MDPTLSRVSIKPGCLRWLAMLLATSAALSATSGCSFENWLRPEQGLQPLEPQLSQQGLIEHLNANISRLHSWSCTDATIYTRPSKLLPFELELSAQVSVERPKNFRLRARSLLGDEADFGSNPERFWFWMRRNRPPYVFTARHEELGAVGRRLQIPFDPAWIMEALGVVPISPRHVTLQQPGSEPNRLLLISEDVSPAQEVIRREIVVDTRLGIVLAHRLFDASGHRLAEARLSDHRREPSGIVMPHRIELDWPQHDMAMRIEFAEIEVNPSHLPTQTWQLPEIPGSPPFEMGRRLNNVESPGVHPPAGERTTESKTVLEPPPFAEPTTHWQPAQTHSTHPHQLTKTAHHADPEPPPFSNAAF